MPLFKELGPLGNTRVARWQALGGAEEPPVVVEPSTIFTPSTPLGGDDLNTGTSFRILCQLEASSLGKLKVSILPGTSGDLDIRSASFGKWAGTAADTTATPIPLTFGGAAGFLGATSVMVSDAIPHPGLSLQEGDTVVIIFDTEPNWDHAHTGYASATNAETWFRAGYVSYAEQAPTGFNQLTNINYGVSLIETE